jgi:hypothetical protein
MGDETVFQHVLVCTYVQQNLPKTELLLHGNLLLFESPVSMRETIIKLPPTNAELLKEEQNI